MNAKSVDITICSPKPTIRAFAGLGRRHLWVCSVVTALLAATLWAPGASAEPKKRNAATAGSKPSVRRPAPVAEIDPAELENAAIVKCDDPIEDFGVFWVGPDLQHTFVIRNAGKSDLEIRRVKPACGCTVAGSYPKTIAPGQSGEFPFTINSKKLRGKFEKGIVISTNDPLTPLLNLKLRGTCNRYIDVLPASANFGKVTTHDQQTRVLKITNNTEKPLEIEVAPKREGDFTFNLIEKKPGQEFELHITLTPPPDNPGPKRAYTHLHTNFEHQKDIPIGAAASVPARLDVQPRTVAIPSGRPTVYKKPIRFTNYGKTPVKLLGATSNEKALKLSINERTAGRAYTINLEVPPNYEVPAERISISLKTDDPEKPVIEIPLRVQGQPRKSDRIAGKRPAEELVGKPAPKFELKTTKGETINNESLAGKVAVLDFFAPNCGFCKKQIPRVDEVRTKYEKLGVRFVTVSQTMRGRRYTDEQVKETLQKLGYDGDLATDPDNKVGPLFKANSFPTMVILGKDGNVAAVNLGNVTDLEHRMRRQLDASIAGLPVPSFAKATPTQKKNSAEQMVGQPVPAFSFETVDGVKVSSDDLAKHPGMVLNFVAANCGYCKKQVPRLDALRKEFEPKGIRFINVAETMRKKFSTEEVVAIFKKKLGAGLELAHDPDNKIGDLFNAKGFPTMVVLGGSGKIEAVNVGNITDLEKTVKAQLESLTAAPPSVAVTVAGQPKPPTPPYKLDKAAENEPKKRQRPAEQLVGLLAPPFSFETLDGKKVTNADLANHPATIFNFVAPNCGYCKKQVPRLDALRKEYEAKGVRFINVAQTMRKKYETEEIVNVFNKTLGSGLELAHDPDNKVGKRFNARSFPTMVILDKKSRVAAVNIGNIGDLETRLKGQLDALIAGKPLPKVAAKKPPADRKRSANERIGKPAPSYAFETLDGKKVTNADLANHPATIFNFVAPNCGYCKKQVPRLDALRKEYEAKGVRFINVAQTMRKKYETEEIVNVFNKTLGSGLELAHDPDNKVGGAFAARGFPTMVVLGKSGKVEAVNIGNIGDLETRLKGQLDALIAGKPLPKVAAKKPPADRKRSADERIGKPAPSYAFETLDGKKVTNADLANHPATIFNFVAPNCGYCKKQVPRLDALRKEYEAKGVRFINVAQTMRKKYETEEIVNVFNKTLGSGLELAHDPDNKVGGAFAARGFPTMVVLGKSGKVEAVNVGNIGDLETRLKGQLDALIAGKPLPKVAAKKPPADRKRSANERIGKPAPSYAFETLDGKKVTNADLANHPATIFNFIAPNCGYCKKQVPRLDALRKEYEAKGVRFINVAQTMRKKYETEEIVNVFNKTLGSGLELAHDPDNKVGGAFAARGFPTMVVLGKSGKVEAVNVGNIGDLETRLKGQLDALIAGKPLPKVAAKKPKTRRRPALDLVGKPAPQFTLQTVDGKTVSTADVGSRPATVLNFVAPNCGYCKRQVPKVESIREEYEKKGVRFVNVALTMRKKFTTDEVVKVFKGVGSNLELAHDPDNKVGDMFKAVSFPTMIVLDKNGTIKHVNIGAKQNLDSMLKEQLDALIKG